jgi:hypothetical protein
MIIFFSLINSVEFGNHEQNSLNNTLCPTNILENSVDNVNKENTKKIVENIGLKKSECLECDNVNLEDIKIYDKNEEKKNVYNNN